MAANRALETESSAPLFRDPLARDLAGSTGFDVLTRFRTALGAAALGGPGDAEPYLALRTRFFDDAAQSAIRSGAISQLVVLAAGMDARAYRLDWPSGLTVFEVDRADVFAVKEPVIARRKPRATCERRIVAADLAHAWTPALLAAGFDPRRPGAFLIEGLVIYLDEPQANRLLRAVGELACAGSWLGLDLASADWFVSPHVAPYLRALREASCPWKFGRNDPEDWLAGHGWHAQAVQPGDPSANYGRWPLPVRPRSLPGIPRNFLVVGERRPGTHAAGR